MNQKLIKIWYVSFQPGNLNNRVIKVYNQWAEEHMGTKS